MTGGLCTNAWPTSTRRFHPARQGAHCWRPPLPWVEMVEYLVDPCIVAANAEIARLDPQGFAHGENGSNTSS